MSQPPEELLKSIGCEPGDDPIDVFPLSRSGALGYWAGLVGLVLLGIVFFGVGVLGAAESEPAERPWFLAGGTAAMFAFFGTAWFWWAAHYRSAADLVYLFENGLIWRTPRDGWKAAQWTDATAVWRYAVINKVGPAGSFTRVEFGRCGREVRVVPNLENYNGLADLFQRAVHRRLLPIHKAQFDAGEAVKFGPVTISKDELNATPTMGSRGGHCPLSEIRDATVMNGCLWLNNRTKGLTPVAVVLSDIPNYTVLIALLPLRPPGWDAAGFE